MLEISIKDLKGRLSAAISEAESGKTIIITRHKEPVAKLVPAQPEYVHRGKNVGKGGLSPGFKVRKRIPYLETLLEDRGDR